MRQFFKNQLFAVVLLLMCGNSMAQLKLDTLQWRSPVGIPIKLSGNFAELRPDHFHAGIDIKTNGKEGYKIYAVQDGYISRIKVSPTGYGKAIYIVHPDGYTSVYTHLSRFNIQIEKYVRSEQYKNESFDVDLYPAVESMKVLKGEVIGLSGNSGSSGGPHLHFEIRKTATSEPLNGLFLGYDILDNIPPKLYQLYVYTETEYANPKASIYSLRKINGSYTPHNGDTIKVNGNFGLGLKVNDYLNGSSNSCGVHYIKVFVDDELYFHSQFDKFSFAETRYINSLMDYKEAVELKRKLHKLYVEPNNKLSVYKEKKNGGIIVPEDGKVKHIYIETADVAGNTSTLKFSVQLDRTIKRVINSNGYLVYYDNNFSIDTLCLNLTIPDNSLYSNYIMEISVDTTDNSNYSNTYRIGNETVPLHKYFTLTVDCKNVKPELENKLVFAKKYKDKLYSAGGIYENGKMVLNTREFGNYFVTLDTIPPTIKPIGDWADSSVITPYSTIAFKIDDDFSGIKSYSGEINGKWVLFEYDPKNNYLYYETDEYFPDNGILSLEVTISDNKGNMAIYAKEFTVNRLSDLKNEQ